MNKPIYVNNICHMQHFCLTRQNYTDQSKLFKAFGSNGKTLTDHLKERFVQQLCGVRVGKVRKAGQNNIYEVKEEEEKQK